MVVKSFHGYHIFMVTAITDGVVPPFADVKEDIRTIFLEKTRVTDKEIEEYYEANIADFTTPARLRLKTILVDKEAKALELKERIEKNNEDFAELAKEFSLDDSTKDKGGDTGLQPEETFDSELVVKAKELAIGKITMPVKLSTGYVIAQLIEKKDEEKQPLTSVTAKIHEQLLGPKKNEMLEEYLKELRNRAKILYQNENFRILEKY
jgi:foldase protein PrsA